MKKIKIESANVKIELEVQSLNNQTIRELDVHLPIESKVKIWGDEIYFDTGISAPLESATLNVEVGDIAYWPQGRCLCIFFGRTPASNSDKPVPVSEVVLVGKTSLDPDLLRQVKPGFRVRVE